LALSPENIEKLARADTLRSKKALSHKAALTRIAGKGVEIATIIDVGAAKGDWSLLARAFWPGVHLHLLEAKELWRKDLEAMVHKQGPASLCMKAVSDTPGAIYFPRDGAVYAGAAFKDPAARDDLIEISATSIDHEVASERLAGPYAIKLDTHGTEVDILRGAEQTLKQTSLLCIETYNFIGQKQFPEMIILMKEYGFRCIDLSEPVFRPVDGALWQIDFYFLREDHPAFETRGFTA